ncbi:unnamed protein product [Schistosoma turkestanicum]|nr:unnamed protein product [Schistosoma turkestanicum]
MECVSRSSEKFIGFATSCDENHSPESVLERTKGSFWITTGIYPQMLTISLVQPSNINKIKIVSSNIKTFLIETSPHTEPENFELKYEKTLPHSGGQLQVTELPLDDTYLHHVRLNIRSGYNHFVAVYDVLFDGK